MDDKSEKDYWGINSICTGKDEDSSQPILKYNPYDDKKDNNILKISENNSNILLLLKNGIIIKIDINTKNNLHKNLIKIKPDIPYGIKLKTKIIDLSCGLVHSLAKGIDKKIYSWGFNNYGQLGLPNIIVGANSEIKEPTSIPKFNEIQIKKIYAKDYCSFCLDINNDIYAFGRNDNHQLNAKTSLNIINIPKKINEIKLDRNSEYDFFTDNQCHKLFFCKVNLPSKNKFENNIEANKRSNEIRKFKIEIKKIEEELNLIKNVRTSIQDLNELITEINSVKKNYLDRKSHIKMTNNKTKTLQESEIQKYDNKLEYYQEIKQKLQKENYLSKYENFIDGRLLISNNKTKNIYEQNKTAINKLNEVAEDKSNKEIYQETSNQKNINNEQEVYLFKKNLPKLSFIFERTLNEEQNKKIKYIEKVYKESKSYKPNHMDDYSKIFDDIILKIKEKIDEINEKNFVSENEVIKNKCFAEYKKNFIPNTLNHCTTLKMNDLNSFTSLREMIHNSKINLNKLDLKIKNIKYNDKKKNIFSKDIINIFQQNIMISQQNNNLMNFILKKLINNVYQNISENVIIFPDIPGYSQLKSKIDKIKNKSEYNKILPEDNSFYKEKKSESTNRNFLKEVNKNSLISIENQKNKNIRKKDLDSKYLGNIKKLNFNNIYNSSEDINYPNSNKQNSNDEESDNEDLDSNDNNY